MKKIRFTEEDKETILQEFKNFIDTLKYDGTEIGYKLNTKVTDEPTATVYFTPTAFCKMKTLVGSCDKEIAWHGVVEKKDNNVYIIKDILVYPQEITGATVCSDDTKYPMWLQNLPDDVFNNLRFQGHSHVNFGATPSGVDTNFYNTMLQQLNNNDYYIFFIMNKKEDCWIQIYDLEKNRIYEKADIVISILFEDKAGDEWYTEVFNENITKKELTTLTTPKALENKIYNKYKDPTWTWSYTRMKYIPTKATEEQLNEVFKFAREKSASKASYEVLCEEGLEELHDLIELGLGSSLRYNAAPIKTNKKSKAKSKTKSKADQIMLEQIEKYQKQRELGGEYYD